MTRRMPLFLLAGLVLSAGSLSAQTYYEDVRPVLVENCVRCHSEAGIAWSMEDAERTYDRAARIARAVQQRRMPPWLAERGHERYVGDYTLPDQTVALIRSWAEGGFAKGDERPDPARPVSAHAFKVDDSVEVLPEREYLPNQERADDYRCFVSVWDSDEPAYLTGFRAVPGNLKVAHHVVVHAVDPSMLDRFMELDEAEEGAGYQCFGGALPDRLGDRKERAEYEARYPDGVRELNRASFWLAHWAPGMDGHTFPEGTGIRLEPGTVLVTQMHYYSRDARGEVDSGSRLDFQLASRVERPGFHFPQTKNEWLGGERNESMVVPAGGMATYAITNELSDLLGLAAFTTQVPRDDIAALEVHSANLHMHAFGHSGTIWLNDEHGEKDVLLNVPRWDLDWQRDFTFLQPKVFDRSVLEDTSLTVECTFENDTDETVYGGYGSYDEMCFNFSYVAVRRR